MGKNLGDLYEYECQQNGTTHMQQCKACWKYERCEPNNSPEPIRHLVYHVCPLKGAYEIWQFNLDELKHRWPLFNGKKTIAVATSRYTDELDDVRFHMDGFDCEFIEVENQPNYRETVSLYPLFSDLRDCNGDNHFTFYAHAKGVTRPFISHVHDWTMAMYHTLLDYWPLVYDLLQRFSVAGSFKKNNWQVFLNSLSKWHYSGTFAWIRNKDLFALDNWSYTDRDWFGMESWLSLHFKQEQAGTVFYDCPIGCNLHKVKHWEKAEKELKEWQKKNEHLLHSHQLSSTMIPSAIG